MRTEIDLSKGWYIIIKNKKESIIYKNFFESKKRNNFSYSNKYNYGIDELGQVRGGSFCGTYITFEEFEYHILNKQKPIDKLDIIKLQNILKFINEYTNNRNNQ